MKTSQINKAGGMADLKYHGNKTVQKWNKPKSVSVLNS